MKKTIMIMLIAAMLVIGIASADGVAKDNYKDKFLGKNAGKGIGKAKNETIKRIPPGQMKQIAKGETGGFRPMLNQTKKEKDRGYARLIDKPKMMTPKKNSTLIKWADLATENLGPLKRRTLETKQVKREAYRPANR